MKKKADYAISTLADLYICTVNVFYFDFIWLDKDREENNELWNFLGNVIEYFSHSTPFFQYFCLKKTIKLWTVAFFFIWESLFFNLILKYLQKMYLVVMSVPKRMVDVALNSHIWKNTGCV